MRWPSLRDHVSLAEDLYGAHGARLVDDWLNLETSRIDDAAFAREFADHLDLPGVTAGDYNHRLIGTSRGDLLGGIRFRGRDVERPFVDVFCHGFDGVAALADCVRAQWREFAPTYLRLHALPGVVAGPTVLLDHTIHVARYRDMTPAGGPLTLAEFDDAQRAVDMVADRYGALAAATPALRRNVGPAADDDLRAWHHAGQLREAIVDGAGVGLLAIAPGAITWLDGDVIMEEVVDVAHRGRGYAAQMQCAWAHSVAVDPDRRLMGTIDRLNVVSRRTAERAGRPAVLEAVFVAL